MDREPSAGKRGQAEVTGPPSVDGIPFCHYHILKQGWGVLKSLCPTPPQTRIVGLPLASAATPLSSASWDCSTGSGH